MKMKTLLLGLTALALPVAAHADIIVLDFEGLAASYPFGATSVGEFYNGGTSGDGISGPDYGISFTNNALSLCLNTPGVGCSNTSRGGVGSPTSQQGGLVWFDGPETFMNVDAGFEVGFSFFYSAPFFPGSISVYDGLSGTGNLLATLDLGLTPNGTCDPAWSGGVNYCPFAAVGVAFDGIAKSVSFAGTANFIVFDDVTFGSITPGEPESPVPEPATWAMLLAGFGVAGAAMRRRRAVEAFA